MSTPLLLKEGASGTDFQYLLMGDIPYRIFWPSLNIKTPYFAPGENKLISSCTLKTLGELSLGTFQQAKPLLMLAYLAIQGPTARRDLRTLLWPNSQQPDASLRVALHLLRQENKHSIQGVSLLSCGVVCDANLLMDLHGQQAVDAYSGAFLPSFAALNVSAEFEEWVEAQRARLAQHVQAEFLTLAESSMPEPAALAAERVYRLPGASPAEPELLRRLLAITLPGSRLEGELRAELKTFGAESTPLPVARSTGRMLGREAELDALLAWSTRAGADNLGQIALVSGSGGIGKSTLLRTFYRELRQQGKQVTLVDAEGARSGSELLNRLLSVVAPGQAVLGTWTGAGALIGDRPVVLLDGVDEIQDLPGLLRLIGNELPESRWVLAGRRRLGRLMVEEHPDREVLLIHLTGLDVPAVGATLNEAMSSSAVELFLREAAQVRRDLELEHGNLNVISGLARRLLGHPLALALAASWLRVEPLDAVALRVMQEGATLSSPGGDRDGRRGLMVVAQRSWDLLSTTEQDAALRLSVGPDFDPADAAALGVSTESVDALLSHSFLEAYQPGSERLRLYPALNGLLQLQLQRLTDLATEVRGTHAQHYLTWFAGQDPESLSVDEERGNLRRAVSSALADRTLEVGILERLLAHYDRRGFHSSGADSFAEIADEAEDAQASDMVQASAQIGTMWLAYRAGRLIDAQALAALFLHGPLSADPASRMKALNTLACVRAQQGQWQRASELFGQARLLARQLGDQVREVNYQTNRLMGLLYQENEDIIRRELTAIEQALPDLPELMAWRVRQSLLPVRLQLSDSDLEELRQEAASISRRGGESSDLTMKMIGLLEESRICLLAGKVREAGTLIEQLKTVLQQAEHAEIETDLAILETRWLYTKGRTSLARQRALQALNLAQKRSNPWDLAELLLVSVPDLETRDSAGLEHHLAAVEHSDRIVFSQRQQARALIERQLDVVPALDLIALNAWLRQQFSAG